MACQEPEETCFCKVFGIDAADPTADVVTWMTGDDLYWKPVTEKGEALTDLAAKIFWRSWKAAEETKPKPRWKKKREGSAISLRSCRILTFRWKAGTGTC